MKPFAISGAFGIVAGVFFFILAVFADGACHCVKSTLALFPYAGLALNHSFESASLPLMIVQFPLYAIVIGLVRSKARIVVILGLLLAHVAVAWISLKG